MGTGLARGVKEIILLQGDAEIVSLNDELIPFLTSLKNLSFDRLFYLSAIHHSLTGNPDQDDSVRLEPFLESEGRDGSSITSLGDDAELESAELMDISSQIIVAEGVPDQPVGLFGSSDKDGCSPKR
jgi:hypothetical protein